MEGDEIGKSAIDIMLTELDLTHMKPLFEELNIDMILLKQMNDSDYSEVFTDFRTRVRIKSYVSRIPIVDAIDVANSSENVRSLSTCSTVVLENSINEITEESTPTPPTHEKNLATSTPKRKRETYFLQCDSVEEFMHQHSKLRAIKCRYDNLEQGEQQLHRSERKKIAEHIVDGLLSRHETVGSSMLESLAEDIVKIFPSESKELYFCPKSGGAKTARGCLYHRYNNEVHLRKKIRKASKKLETPAVEDASGEEEEAARRWLLFSAEPWEDVEKYWRSSFHLRQKNVKMISVVETIEKWPILKHPRAFTLVS